MKTVHRKQMETFEGATLKELEIDFNRKMEWVSRYSEKYAEPVIDIQNLRGYVIYEETQKIAEGYRDQLELHGVRVTCGECKEFCPSKYSNGVCQYCRGNLRKNDEACDKFFKAWENGDCWMIGEEEKYGEILDELRCTSIRRIA